jgi:hypothetical protein
MEQVATPTAEAPVSVAPPVMESTPPPTSEYAEGGALGSFTSRKMNLKDMFFSGLFIAFGIMGILYYSKAIKKLGEQPTKEEYENMSGDLDEVKYNVQKALGKRYETT